MATKQRFEIETIFHGNIKSINDAIQEIQKKLNTVGLPKDLDKGFSSTLNKLGAELRKFESLSKSGIGSSADFKAVEKSGQNIINLYNRLQLEMRELNGLTDKDLRNLFPSSISENIKRATTVIKEYKQNVKPTTKEEEKLTKQLQAKKKKLEELNAAQTKANSLSKEDAIKSKERSLKSYQNYEAKAQAKVDANPNDSKAVADLERYKAKVQEVTQAINQLKSKSAEEIRSEALNKLKSEADGAQKEVLELENSLTSIKSTNATAFNNLVAKLKEITGVDFSNLTYSEENLAKMQTTINGLDASRIKQIRDSFKPLGQEIKQAGEATKPLTTGMVQAERATEALVRKKQELDTFKNTLTYFFSINNMFHLLRRAINEAFKSIADLDKAMTATAVVTDFTVGDMWEQLPRYTKIANELGVTTLGAYETMTLFYQQGLNTNEAFELGAETMKMARIAGLDYAEATDKMTAALRGFNMELNTLSAQRVSDVYSQLAAITAADTEEISTAMTKTASIANSANMEFETTAAFLSQIIETTRESAETAGTALKTVIARFQELKKDPAEIGEVDGEVVDANKIETALRSVGVALRDTSGQFRDLDDVFLELSEKWDTLDVNTQRYVATIAAGSRQQSRFIAMMSDYSRTVELVDAAYGSAGASQKQYEKTLESWESKVAQLKNAWQEFVLGIIDSDLAKFIVDTGTTTLNILNKLTKGVGGLSTTFLRLGVVIGGLKLGKVLLPALGSSLLDKSKPFGVGLGKSIKEGLKVEFGKKKGFKIPIGISPSLPTKNQKEIGRLTDSISNAYYARRDPSGLENRRHKLIQEQQALRTQYLNASAAAQLRYNAAVAQGIPVEEAETLLTKKSTVEDYKKMAASHGVEAAQIEETVATQGSILARIQQTLATKIETWAETKRTAATWLGTVANWAHAHSSTAAKIAMLGMAAAAVAVIAGIVALAKHAKNNTLEKKMERAAEATKQAKEAADSAKDAYQDLIDTITSLDDHEKELNTLIEGTDAWREKVAEINSEFTKLIDLYPDLQKVVEFDADKGIFQWTDGGKAARDYLDDQNKAAAARQYEWANSQQRERDLALAKEVSSFSYSARVAKYADTNTVHDKERNTKEKQTLRLSTNQAKTIAAELEKKGGRATEEELTQILTSALPNANKELIASLAKNSEALYSLTDSINNDFVDNRPQTQAYIQTLLSSNDAYKNIEDPHLKKYIVATAANKTEEEGFTNDKYNTDSKIISEYLKRNQTDLDTTYGKGKYTVKSEGGNIVIKDSDNNIVRTAGTVEQVRKQLSIEDYVTGELDVADQTKQFNNEVGAVLKTLYDINDINKATAEQLQNAQQVVTHAALNNVKATDDLATGLAGLSFAELENLIFTTTDNDIKEQASRAVANKSSENIGSTIESASQDKIDQNESSLRSAASALELSDTALQSYTQHILANNAALGDNKEALNAVARESLETEKAFADIIPILEDEEEALKDIGSPQYFKAIDKIFNSLNGMLNLNNLTAADLTPEHLELIKAAAGGSEEALKQLREEMVLLSLQKLDLPVDTANQLVNILSSIDGFSVEAGVSLNDANFVAALNHMVQSGAIAKTQLDQLLLGKGYEMVQTGTTTVPAMSVPFEDRGDNWLESLWNSISGAEIEVPTFEFVALGEDANKGLQHAITTSGGGNSSSDSGNDYKADYDKHYNKMEDLAEEQRVRNDLEEEYNKLLRDNNTTISDITKNINAQIDSLKREREIQEFLYDARRQQIRDTMSEYSDLQGYASYNFVDNTIEIDYDAIRAITDEEVGSRIDEYISKLEEFQDQMDEANDALAEIEEQIIEALEKGKEEYFSLEERAMDALVHSYEQEIDELNRINDSINDANSELLNSINSTLERQRREEENAEKEQELSDMQRRLDYLRQDTSGANALEIKQLEKELAEAQDDYTDSLIDQKISELEEQNDKAAEQRERQIAFAEAQLEAAQKTGALWDEIHKMFDTDIDENGIKTDSKLLQLLMAAEDVPSQSELERNKWLADLYAEVKQGFSWLQDKNDVSDLIQTGEVSEGQTIKFTDAKGHEYDGIVNKDGSVTANDAIFHNVKRDHYGKYTTTETYDEAKQKTQANKTPEPTPPAQEQPKEVKVGSRINAAGATIYADSYGNGGDTQYYDDYPEYVVVDELNGYVAAAHVTQPADIYHAAGWFKKRDVTAFKTGGLADFTGPAWLDGTKSRPELVLNQRDTQNFIQLRNVLAEATKSGFGKSENSEAVMFDIDINIDKVENEENVDALLTELERRINSYASYRNVTALTLKR